MALAGVTSMALQAKHADDRTEAENSTSSVQAAGGGRIVAQHIGAVRDDEAYVAASLAGAEKTPARVVGIGIKVEDLSAINSVEHRFTATLKVSYEWELKPEEAEEWEKDGWAANGGRPPWEPRITWPTVVDTEKDEELRTLGRDGQANVSFFDTFRLKNQPNGPLYTVVYMRKRLKFSQTQELHNFPFDCQDMIIRFQSDNVMACRLGPRFKSPAFASIDLENCGIRGEWILHAPVAAFHEEQNKKSRSGAAKSEFVFQIKLQRRHNYYTDRILYLVALLTVGSLLSFLLGPHDSNRVVLVLTVMLTLVAFQLAVDMDLPNVQYFTLLDYYMVFCQRFIMVNGVVCAICVRFFPDSYDYDSEESWFDSDFCFIVLSLVLIAYHLWYTWWVYRAMMFEQEKLELHDHELEEFLRLHNDDWMYMMGFKSLSNAKARKKDSDTYVYKLNSNDPDKQRMHERESKLKDAKKDDHHDDHHDDHLAHHKGRHRSIFQLFTA